MDIKVLINVNSPETKEVTERLVKQNLENKLDSYLKKFTDKQEAEGTIEVKIEKSKKDTFNGIVHANLDGKTFRYERDDYKNLDDLLNHLFDHFKEELSSL
ncbi:hypothetical protein D8B46_03380 [Candidatus Gracilibacteria bacterium]|nr:MAG: hypothetical protein D8B46_03380 [Candidatus Gracilibacteria bacterium]